jgi:transposase
MPNQVKKYNSDFKLKVVLKYLSEKRTCSQICSEFQVSKSTLHKWVSQFKENSHLVFNNSDLSSIGSKKKKKEWESKEKEISNLYSKVGQLTMERDFLKKVLDA